jgi:hypothetical protein
MKSMPQYHSGQRLSIRSHFHGFRLPRYNGGMKALVFAVVVAGLLVGCRKPTTDTPDPQSWFIESYTDGLVTARHQGKAYKAKCDISRSFNNANSAADPKNVHTFPTCDLVIEFVGQNIQSFKGKQKDANGWTTNMWSVGSTLTLRSWRDEHTAWRQDNFVITSVASSQDGINETQRPVPAASTRKSISLSSAAPSTSTAQPVPTHSADELMVYDHGKVIFRMRRTTKK